MDAIAAHESDSPAPRARPALTTGTLIAACLAVCVGQVGLAIPAVLNGLFQSDLHTTSSQLTWISDAFLVPVTLLELTFGVLGDLFGRKRLLVGGAVTLAVGELVAALGPAGTAGDARVLVLWGGQIVAGIGAAALFPTTLAMIAAGTHTINHRSRSITLWAASLSAGGFVSPVLGGLITKLHWGDDPTASWRWAFLAVAALALISAATSLALAVDSSAPAGRSLDWPGQITIAVALFALLFAVIQGPTSGWGSAWVVGGFIVAVLALGMFIAVESRTASPLLQLRLFTNRAFAMASVATVFGMFCFLGTAYATSIRLAAIQGFTPLKASIAFVLFQGTALVLMPATARVLERFNPKWAMGGGAVLMAAGDFWMSSIPARESTDIAPMLAPFVVIGCGFAFAVSALTAVAVNTVPNRLAGMASGTTSLLRDFGFTLGPAVVGAVALSRAAAQIQHAVNGSEPLRNALSAFDKSPEAAPPAQRAALEEAVGAVHSGPLGANGVPGHITLPNGQIAPFNPLHDVAFHALDSAYSLGYLICGICGVIAAVIAFAGVGGHADEPMVTEESLA